MTKGSKARTPRTEKLANTNRADRQVGHDVNQLKKHNNSAPLACEYPHDKNQFPLTTRNVTPTGIRTTNARQYGTVLARRRQTASTSLTVDQVLNLRSAAAHADLLGLPLNRMATINWEQGGIEDVVAATGKFLKLMRDWLRVNGGQFSCIWVQECGPVTGHHVHLLMHVSPSLARRTSHRQRGWLKACGATYRKGMLKTSRIGASYKAAMSKGYSRKAYLTNLSTVVDYVLKDVSAYVRRRFGIRHKGNCGRVYGKRCGTSQNVGKSARSMCSAVNEVATDPSPICGATEPQSCQPL